MNEIVIIISPETGSDTQHTLIRDTRFYCVIGPKYHWRQSKTNCFVPEESKIKIQKATDNKWWLFHFQCSMFLFGAFITEFKAAHCEEPSSNLVLSPGFVCHRSVK